MDLYSVVLLIVIIFFLITLPLLGVAQRLSRMIRILTRIENMNMRSLQRWGV